nr:MAG TPA: HopJ type III effector protein [Caudoviricetes sp.]
MSKKLHTEWVITCPNGNSHPPIRVITLAGYWCGV